jgi:hypothetical protein
MGDEKDEVISSRNCQRGKGMIRPSGVNTGRNDSGCRIQGSGNLNETVHGFPGDRLKRNPGKGKVGRNLMKGLQDKGNMDFLKVCSADLPDFFKKPRGREGKIGGKENAPKGAGHEWATPSDRRWLRETPE